MYVIKITQFPILNKDETQKQWKSSKGKLHLSETGHSYSS